MNSDMIILCERKDLLFIEDYIVMENEMRKGSEILL